MAAISLRDYQQAGVDGIRAAFRRGDSPVLFVLPTGGGKCLGAGTPVLMFDGTIKLVEDIVVGDLLMGPDSQPRTVLSLARGSEALYRVTPVKGDSYVVNESHILSLKRTTQYKEPKYPCQGRAGEIVNISVADYLGKSKHFKHIHKGWRAAVDFPQFSGPEVIEPYFLGMWLGDGHSHVAEITTGDPEIVSYITGYAERLGMTTVTRPNSENSIGIRIIGHTHTGRGGTVIMNALRAYGLQHNKHIPHRWKTGSRDERLQVLAGLIDSDGHYNGKGFDVTLGDERLMDDMIFIARSLGFSAYKVSCRKTCTNNGKTGDYFRCSISGDIDQVPCLLPRKQPLPRLQKKSPLVTGISVEPIGHGDYYGFEIDGDHLFMLGDFTVTHNTYTFSYIASSAAERDNTVIIIVHRKELLLQASQALTNLGIAHGMISPHFTADPRQKVQVASIDTLIIRLKKRKYEFSLCIFDEAHHVLAKNKWGIVWDLLGKPPMLGVTATPVRGDGKGLGAHCGGVFLDMVQGPTVLALIGKGMLLNPIVYTSLEQPDLDGLKTNSEGDYNLADLAQRVDKPRITGSAVKQYTKICPGARAIVFCASIAHARHVVEQFNAAGYRFALLVGQPEMSDAERTDVNKRLRRGDLDGACTVDLVSEGYDLPDLSCCIMLRPTASEALFLQQVGRVMRPSDGKTKCWLLDHVGNVGSIQDGEFKRKHGMPNEEREWSLDGKPKGKGKKKVEKVIDVFQCPKCYLAHMPEPTCPGCGHVYEIKTRQLEEVEGDLHELTPEMAEAIKRDKKIEVGKAKDLAELQRIAVERGYKPGWAKAIFESRKRKKPKAPERPPEPTLDELKAMTLEQLERVAREQNWGRDFASDFYHSQHALEGNN